MHMPAACITLMEKTFPHGMNAAKTTTGGREYTHTKMNHMCNPCVYGPAGMHDCMCHTLALGFQYARLGSRYSVHWYM
jgi:hypothetical protein